MKLDFNTLERKEIIQFVIKGIENYYSNTKSFSPSPELELNEIKQYVNSIDLDIGIQPQQAIRYIVEGLESYGVHTPHPKYFGLFNPRSNFAGIVADLLTATYNPQLAAWSHAPFAVETEMRLIRDFAVKFGYNVDTVNGTFTTGGAEANLSAILCALNHKFPNFAKDGLLGLKEKPVIFCSQEAHHSIQKAAKIVGLGYNSVKSIPLNKDLKLDVDKLRIEINALNNTSYMPLMVIATAGTTGMGMIDDLIEIGKLCKVKQLWCHIDAAYGGGAILSSKLRGELSGIELSDSITFDAHKWMSVPMGTSMFITCHKHILGRTFGITTEYMPKEAKKLDIIEPFTNSIQWSRRFNGLKVYLSLLFYGWEGYDEVITNQAKMGAILKTRLIESGWEIVNNTSLPVICFTDPRFKLDPKFVPTILDQVLKNKKSWISSYPIHGLETLRVCITNYNTTEVELDELIKELNAERLNFIENLSLGGRVL